jgi:hypothetical protein
MDCRHTITQAAAIVILISTSSVVHAQPVPRASDTRESALQPVNEMKDFTETAAIIVDAPTALRFAIAPLERASDGAASRMFEVAAAVDWATTVHSLAFHRGRENNPLINWAPTTATTIAVGAAIDLAGLAVWQRMTRDHPRLSAAGLYVSAAMRVFVAGRNEYRIAHVPPCAMPASCQ